MHCELRNIRHLHHHWYNHHLPTPMVSWTDCYKIILIITIIITFMIIVIIVILITLFIFIIILITFTERWMRKIQVIQTETSTVQSKAIWEKKSQKHIIGNLWRKRDRKNWPQKYVNVTEHLRKLTENTIRNECTELLSEPKYKWEESSKEGNEKYNSPWQAWAHTIWYPEIVLPWSGLVKNTLLVTGYPKTSILSPSSSISSSLLHRFIFIGHSDGHLNKSSSNCEEMAGQHRKSTN